MDKREESFGGNLKLGPKKKIESLIRKNRASKIYNIVQIYFSLAIIIVFIVYYYFYLGNKSFNGMAGSYEFIIAVIGLAIFNVALEKAEKEIKKQEDIIRSKLKEVMKSKVCTCKNPCECKEEINDYLEEKGIELI